MILLSLSFLFAGEREILEGVGLRGRDPGGREEANIQGLHARLGGWFPVQTSLFSLSDGGWRSNAPCFLPAAAARMPAPPLEDEEALQEVQEAPQEALALSIGLFIVAAPMRPASCASSHCAVIVAVRAPSPRRRSTTRRRRGPSPSLRLSAPPAASLVSGSQGARKKPVMRRRAAADIY